MSETAFIDPQFLKENPMEHEGASLSSQMVNVGNLSKAIMKVGKIDIKQILD